MTNKGRGHFQSAAWRATEQAVRPRGETHGLTVLTEQDVRTIRARRGVGYTCKELAAVYAVTAATISNVARGKTWGHVI